MAWSRATIYMYTTTNMAALYKYLRGPHLAAIVPLWLHYTQQNKHTVNKQASSELAV